MARGYLQLNEDGTWDAIKVQQGMESTFSSDDVDGAYGWEKKIAQHAAEAKPGLYRVTFSTDTYAHRVMLFVTIGAKVANRAKEADRLRKQRDKAAVQARTGMPGISGYQHMENMATARLVNNRSETTRLIEWLSK